MLKVFGCLCYASTYPSRKKFDAWARWGIFLGFQTGTKGHVISDLNYREIFIFDNIWLNEKVFPFTKFPSNDLSNNQSLLPATSFFLLHHPPNTQPNSTSFPPLSKTNH